MRFFTLPTLFAFLLLLASCVQATVKDVRHAINDINADTRQVNKVLKTKDLAGLTEAYQKLRKTFVQSTVVMKKNKKHMIKRKTAFRLLGTLQKLVPVTQENSKIFAGLKPMFTSSPALQQATENDLKQLVQIVQDFYAAFVVDLPKVAQKKANDIAKQTIDSYDGLAKAYA